MGLMEDDVPMQKSAVLTKKIALAVDPDTKERWDRLTKEKRVDTAEWLRGLLRSELPKLEEKVA